MSEKPTREHSSALPLHGREAPVKQFDADSRTLDVVWSTGAAVRRRRYDWDSGRVVEYDEILVISRSAIDLSRFNSGRAPVLKDHAGWSIDNQMGSVKSAQIDEQAGEARATLQFPRAGIKEEIDELFSLATDESGTHRNLSVGYSIDHVRKEVDEKNGGVEKWYVDRWTPYEISFVAMGADPAAQVRSADDRSVRMFPVTFTVRDEPGATQEADMAEKPETAATSAAPNSDETATRAAPPAPPAAPAVDVAAERAAAAAAERARSAEIRLIGRKHKMPEEFVDQAIEKGTGVQDFRNAVLDKLAAAGDAPQIRPEVQTVRGGQDETETRRQAAIDALLHRAAPGRFQLTDPARAYRGMTLIRMAEESLVWRGENVRGLNPNEIAQRALHTTSDFPAILAAVTNKMFLGAYQAAPQTFGPIVRQMTLSDFNEAHLIRMGSGPKLKKIGEHGEYKRGSIVESKETIKVSTYGIVVGITRQVIINDDLGAFTRLPQQFGTSVATLESDIVWGLWLSNPQLKQDSTAVFHTAKHANLASSGTLLAEPAVSIGQTAMSKQLDLDGKTNLNVVPSYLVVPSELRAIGEKMLASFVPSKASDVVPESIRRMQLIVEPRLSNGVVDADNGINASGSATAWYLAVDPNSAMVDTIVVATLEGQDGPYTETRQGFDIDGMEIKCRHDFGAAWADFRGVYKDPGAAS